MSGFGTSRQEDIALHLGFERSAPLMASLLTAFVVVQQPAQAASTPPAGVWDVQPHSLDIKIITPETRCQLNYNGKDGTFVGYSLSTNIPLRGSMPEQLAANPRRPFLGRIDQQPTLKLVVSRSGQSFYKGLYYDATLRNLMGTLTLKMSPLPEGSLFVRIIPQMDPKDMLPKLLQTGFTLTISLRNVATLLREEIPASGANAVSQLQSCFSMVFNSEIMEMRHNLKADSKPAQSAP